MSGKCVIVATSALLATYGNRGDNRKHSH